MDSAELSDWIAWERYKAARKQAAAAQNSHPSLLGGL